MCGSELTALPDGVQPNDVAMKMYNDMADLRAAIDALVASVPGLRQVVLWGLCGSCTSNLLYGYQDRRVSALVLVNPWVRSPGGLARTQLWHYYPKRLREGAFWRDILRGRLELRAAARGLARAVSNAWRPPVAPGAGAASPTSPPAALLPQRMLDGLRRFPGPALFILSESDLAAQEFGRLVADTRAWRQAMRAPRITCQWLPGADHTLSARADHRAASRLIVDWLLAHGTRAGHEQPASHTGACTTPPIHEETSWTRPGRP